MMTYGPDKLFIFRALLLNSGEFILVPKNTMVKLGAIVLCHLGPKFHEAKREIVEAFRGHYFPMDSNLMASLDKEHFHAAHVMVRWNGNHGLGELPADKVNGKDMAQGGGQQEAITLIGVPHEGLGFGVGFRRMHQRLSQRSSSELLLM
ncbi:hypothetical protein UY3_15501 [Chelonia mydas]|uniref:Uncharacterized protein n=1 Tax=Chelonia mydas TaxID=8469 RepID=M7AWJ3_CHEMY|nr:hypothetical protein UY3_15501 [Chelonia mydas]